MTSVDLVRGVLAAAHAFVSPGVAEKDLWRAFRQAYSQEPFVRLVKDRTGLHRLPEPKILAGSNYADVGFDLTRPLQTAGKNFEKAKIPEVDVKRFIRSAPVESKED